VSRVVCVVGGASMWLGWCMVWVYVVVVCGHVWVDVHVRYRRCSNGVYWEMMCV
jgi:hypothetical protein